VRRDDRFLVRQRPEGAPLAGLWEFPGGKCEPGEPPAEAVRRECLEELGVEVRVGPLRLTRLFDYPHARLELWYFDCALLEPGAVPAASTGFRWVAAAEFPGLAFPEANRPVIEDLVREFAGGGPSRGPRDGPDRPAG